MPIAIGQVSDLLSIIASTGQLITMGLDYVRSRTTTGASKSDTSLIVNQSESAGKAAAEQFINRHESISANMSSMSENIFDSIRRNITKIANDIIDVLDDEHMPMEEKEKRLDRLKREFCWFIWQSKDYHYGAFPDFLLEEWNKNGCDKFKFK